MSRCAFSGRFAVARGRVRGPGAGVPSAARPVRIHPAESRSGRTGRTFSARRLRLAAFTAAAFALAGCGAAVVEQVQNESAEVERQISALRAAPPGPRLSAVRVIERRPYAGIERTVPDAITAAESSLLLMNGTPAAW